jgi:mono/diheme cytochrome c family protein
MRADLRRLALAALPLVLGACSGFTDFKRQPTISPWETASDTIPPRGNPQLSVPVQGAMVPGFVVSYTNMPQQIDSMAGLANPVPADARSLLNGRKLYQINCAVCHGQLGNGMGAATKYGMIPMPIVSPATQARSDGYIWGMIRNGRGSMPSYNRIEEMERWDVVNYVRALQGRVPGFVVDTLPLGRPGETGATLPHATEIGPTRPAPYFKHLGAQAGVRRATNASPPAAPGAQPALPADSAARAATPGQPPAGATGAARPTDTTRKVNP